MSSNLPGSPVWPGPGLSPSPPITLLHVHPAPHLFLQLDGGECPGSPGHWALVRRGYCSQQIIVDSAAALLTQLETVGPTPSTALHCC